MSIVAATLRASLLVAEKDLRSEARTRTVLQGVGFYAALAALLFSFALGPDAETLRRFAPGLLWLSVALASLLAVGRSFASEREQGTLETLLLYPVPREALFLGKLAASFAVLLVVAVAALGLMAVLYTLPWPERPGLLLAALLLGALGLALAGTFYGAVSAQLRAREALVPMLLLPVLVPLVIAAAQLTESALAGGGSSWLQVLAVFDLLLLVLSLAVFPYLFEE
ncbi:MAG: heme exporter protein CcmB [Gaiellaceae bacterium]